jgi:DNA-binding XRE family transcriptional regulator
VTPKPTLPLESSKGALAGLARRSHLRKARGAVCREWLGPVAQSVPTRPAIRRGTFSSGGASCYTLLAARLHFSPANRVIGRSVELVSHRLPNAIDRHVASRSRQRRVEAGLTQTTLADALGISFQQLQKYEGATNRISAGALYQLALTLDVPVQYFFDGLSRRDKKRG